MCRLKTIVVGAVLPTVPNKLFRRVLHVVNELLIFEKPDKVMDSISKLIVF